MFYAPELVFGGIEGIRSHFHALRDQTRYRLYRARRTGFRRFRGRLVPFSCFAHPNTFSAVPRASGPVFIFCAPGLVFSGAECVRSRFFVLCTRTRFRRSRGRRVPFSCFALAYMLLAVLMASCPDFMFCAPGFVFDGNKGVGFRFQILRS
jgi:hypothetical protein